MTSKNAPTIKIWWIRIRRILAFLVGVYLARMFVRNGWDKFDPDGFWAEPFANWGYPVWLRLLVGFIEAGGGILILIPWTATYSGIAVAAVMAGAFYTRMGSGFPNDLMWIAGYAVALLWIAFEWRSFRRPKLFTSKENDEKARRF